MNWDDVFQMVPRLKGEDRFSLSAQAAKIVEEANEFLNASGRDGWCEELGDLIHASIVLLKMKGIEVTKTFLEGAIEKNRQRGYYEEDGK